MYEFNGADFEIKPVQPSDSGLRWAQARFCLRDKERGVLASTKVRLAVPDDPSLSVQELRMLATEKMLRILREVLYQLAACEWEDLRRHPAERHGAERLGKDGQAPET